MTQKDNIEISNEMISKKAEKYLEQKEFESTQQIGEQILALSKCIGGDEKAHMYYKTLLEIRKLDLLCFIYYRF